MIVQGSRRRERRELERLAWHASMVMNVWLEDKVTAADLLGGGASVEQPLLLDDESARDRFRELQAEVAEQRREAELAEELAALEAKRARKGGSR